MLPVQGRIGAQPQGGFMVNTESLFSKAVEEIDRMLNAKTVVGEPITVAGNTLIPLISVGFGFGAGGSEAADAQKGAAGGVGGGGGVKPVALIIVSQDGVRVESVKGAAASLVDKLSDVAARFAPGKPAAG
jgi:uncharacterized spore protein YtfJ